MAFAATAREDLQSELQSFGDRQEAALEGALAKFETESQQAKAKIDAYGAQIENQNAKLFEGLARIDKPDVIANALVASDTSRVAIADTLWTTTLKTYWGLS